ncbi:hypothetical protein LMG26858_04429 [Achromobacter anxifer]|uniref:DUF3168 domain-containing protein n=1 Tax=Achromobacter anxifer TaxID=1287737 RepID=A0A6S7EGN8_9BURK|nr:DUF3168 domain-containing protein [Achromobacter anxifer]CAB3904885.1 hypothetical protein LMG26858_04429 [Achromobacter anxifer]CAB5512051.1 hypothetical protein LMG26857_01340 [Achromobacter anxifer]
MLAPVFKTINTQEVRGHVGDKPRIYGSGMAPQGVSAPYITWFTVIDNPYDQLSGPPDADNGTVQIDCWTGPNDDQEAACISLAGAVRDALDVAGIANRVFIHTRETDTKLFRIGLQADFIRGR